MIASWSMNLIKAVLLALEDINNPAPLMLSQSAAACDSVTRKEQKLPTFASPRRTETRQTSHGPIDRNRHRDRQIRLLTDPRPAYFMQADVRRIDDAL